MSAGASVHILCLPNQITINLIPRSQTCHAAVQPEKQRPANAAFGFGQKAEFRVKSCPKSSIARAPSTASNSQQGLRSRRTRATRERASLLFATGLDSLRGIPTVKNHQRQIWPEPALLRGAGKFHAHRPKSAGMVLGGTIGVRRNGPRSTTRYSRSGKVFADVVKRPRPLPNPHPISNTDCHVVRQVKRAGTIRLDSSTPLLYIRYVDKNFQAARVTLVLLFGLVVTECNMGDAAANLCTADCLWFHRCPLDA